MKKAKYNLMSKIAKESYTTYANIQNNLKTSKIVSQELRKIRELRFLYDLTDKFPVWPFDFQTVRNYFLSASTPIITPLVALGKDQLFHHLPK